MQTASLAWHIMSLQMPGSQKVCLPGISIFVVKLKSDKTLRTVIFCFRTAMFLFRHRIVLIYNDMQWQNFLYPHKVFFSFFLVEASLSDAGYHIGYVILVYLRQYPCKKSAPSVPSPRWTGPVIRVNSRCHLCETAASHRWSNKAIRLFVSIRPRACFSPSYNKVKSQTCFVWLLTLL